MWSLKFSFGLFLMVQSICWQYVKQVFTSCDDLLRKKQFCYILARHVSPEFDLLFIIFWVYIVDELVYLDEFLFLETLHFVFFMKQTI